MSVLISGPSDATYPPPAREPHLDFHSYGQRVELFVQFFEHNQLLQRETAEPGDRQTEEERRKKKKQGEKGQKRGIRD